MDMEFMENLLCPQISMDVDETPLELGVKVGDNDNETEEDATDEMPMDVKIKILLETEQFDASQIPEQLTEEEEALKKTVFNLGPAVQFTKLHCTSCNQHLGSAPVNQFNRFIHPLLHVLLCKSCYDFYCSGEFEKDEDGSELYCRWCGQGGKVMCCSDCCFVFCQKCVRTNLGKKTLDGIKNADDWKCFVCNPQQLINLKLTCHSLYHYVVDQIKIAKETNNEKILTQDQTMCCKQVVRTPRPTKRKRNTSNEDTPYVPGEEDLKKIKRVKIPTLPSPSVPSTNGSHVINPMAIRTPTMVNHIIGINPMRAVMPRLAPILPKPRMTVPQHRPAIAGSQNYISLPNQNPLPQIRFLQPQQRYKSVINSVPSAVTPGMRHNWFEQASSLTTSITNQLIRKLAIFNIEQKNANSIEKLAGIHNQLQELLSNSVNQLIHIRKNLRSEFLSDLNKLKASRPTMAAPTVRLVPPTLPILPMSESHDDDDDVILVNNDDPLACPEPQIIETPQTSIDPNQPRPFIKLRPVSSLMAPSSTTTTEHIDLCDDDDDVIEPRAPENEEKEKEKAAPMQEKIDIGGVEEEKCEVLGASDDTTRQQILRALLKSEFEAAVVENTKIKIASDPRLTVDEVNKMLKARVIVDPKYIPKRKCEIDENIFLNEADISCSEVIGVSDGECESTSKKSDDGNEANSTQNEETNSQESTINTESAQPTESETTNGVAETNDKSNPTDDEEMEKSKTESEVEKSINEEIEKRKTESEVEKSINEEIEKSKTESEVEKSINEEIEKSKTESEVEKSINEEIEKSKTESEVEKSINGEIEELNKETLTDESDNVAVDKTNEDSKITGDVEEVNHDENNTVGIISKTTGDVEEESLDENNTISQCANSDNYDRRKSVTDIEASADPVTTTDSGIEVDAK